MYWRKAGALAGALLMVGAFAVDAFAQPRFDREERRRFRDREWVLLGEKSVGFGVDRDVVRINQPEDWFRSRTFRSLHLVADRNDVHMMAVRLVYLNGFAEDFRVDRLIRDGEDMPIDLRGERSFIRQIEMVYRSRPGFRGEAVIRVYGEPSRRGGPGGPFPPPGPGPGPFPGPGPGASWTELGCKQVSLFGKDRDTIPVGRREGRFKAIRLHARGADVELMSVSVVYANGEPDNLPTRHFLRQGGYTPPLDLKGYERRIDRVEMVYRTVPNFKGVATVCVEGMQ